MAKDIFNRLPSPGHTKYSVVQYMCVRAFYSSHIDIYQTPFFVTTKYISTV